MKTDLQYIETGMFVRFIPNTPAGEDAWRVMAAQGNEAVLAIHKRSVLNQLRAAGYSVAKAKPVKAGEMDLILAELGV